MMVLKTSGRGRGAEAGTMAGTVTEEETMAGTATRAETVVETVTEKEIMGAVPAETGTVAIALISMAGTGTDLNV